MILIAYLVHHLSSVTPGSDYVRSAGWCHNFRSVKLTFVNLNQFFGLIPRGHGFSIDVYYLHALISLAIYVCQAPHMILQCWMGQYMFFITNNLFTYLQKQTGNGLSRLSGIIASGAAHM